MYSCIVYILWINPNFCKIVSYWQTCKLFPVFLQLHMMLQRTFSPLYEQSVAIYRSDSHKVMYISFSLTYKHTLTVYAHICVYEIFILMFVYMCVCISPIIYTHIYVYILSYLDELYGSRIAKSKGSTYIHIYVYVFLSYTYKPYTNSIHISIPIFMYACICTYINLVDGATSGMYMYVVLVDTIKLPSKMNVPSCTGCKDDCFRQFSQCCPSFLFLPYLVYMLKCFLLHFFY